MKLRKVFLLIWVFMLIFAVSFLFYAANHPEGSFPWSLSITYMIYRIYLIMMVLCFITWLVIKIRFNK